MKRYRGIEELPIFRGISKDTIHRMCTHGKIVTMKKGTVCYRANDRQSDIYILLDGQAIIYTLTRCGNRKIIFILGGGEFLNESIITPGKTTVFCEVIAESRVFVIKNDVFCKLMEKDFTLVKAVMKIQERKLWRTSHQLKNTLGSIYLEKKLAAKLWKLARDFGEPMDKKGISGNPEKENIRIGVSLSITFLADMLGAPRETTSRFCKSLSERGFIQMEKKTIIVRNMDCLSNFYKNHCGEECHCSKD